MEKYQQGFTLIELITVIILLGILSAFAISRFPTTQGYSTRIIGNQLIASARLAQQTALSRSSMVNTSLAISEVAGNWNLVISGDANQALAVDRGNEQIHFGTDLIAACSTLAAAPLTITFDGDGNRVPAQNLRICIDATAATETDIELCISPAGYAYEGTCFD